jgi:hypothetical protein
MNVFSQSDYGTKLFIFIAIQWMLFTFLHSIRHALGKEAAIVSVQKARTKYFDSKLADLVEVNAGLQQKQKEEEERKAKEAKRKAAERRAARIRAGELPANPPPPPGPPPPNVLHAT